jgi:hypothetical protein
LPALVLAMLAAAGLGFLRPGIALAATPTVEMVSVNTSDLVPAGDLCSFDVTFTGTGTPIVGVLTNVLAANWDMARCKFWN